MISSLCDYHKYLTQSGKVEFAPDGYTKEENVTTVAVLSKNGELVDVVSLGVQDGKTSFTFPHAAAKTSISSHVAEHRPEYLFGLEMKGGKLILPSKRDKFEAFQRLTLEFFEELNSPIAKAYYLFAKNWVPENETENAVLLKVGSWQLKFVFCLEGRPDQMLQDDPEVLAKWNKQLAEQQSQTEDILGECSVFGKELPIARVHDKIKNVAGGKSSVCALVCVNNPSEESYNKTQSYNCNISELAMKQYTQALNYLLSDKNHNKVIDGLTIVHFALTTNEEKYNQFVNFSLFDDVEETPSSEESVENVDVGLHETAILLSQGRKAEMKPLSLDENVEYCFIGFVPNISRLSVRFSYRNTFGQLKKNVDKYHEDFAIGDMTGAPAFEKINKELISPKKAKKDKKDSSKEKKKEKIPPDVTRELLASMLQGTPFPQKILQTVVRRIKTDLSEDIKSSIRFVDNEQVKIRVGLVKACLNRKIKNEKEKITMALNKQNPSVAYQCGRLFAVLEDIQKKASNNKLNKTIVDSYFSSAASTPALVFPKLVMLSQNHLDKLSDGPKIYYSKLCGEIIDNIVDEFPKTLALEDQGKFIVGYYQQKTDLYSKKEKEEE